MRGLVSPVFICLSLITSAPLLRAQEAGSISAREQLLVPGNLAEIEGALDDIRGLLDSIDSADAEGGIFRNGKGDYQAKLNDELGTLLDALTDSTYAGARSSLVALDARINAANDRLERLRIDLRLAPKGNGDLSLTDRALMREAAPGSENAIRTEMAGLEAEIADTKVKRTTLINDLIDELSQKFGFFLTQKQATALLYQVNGSSIVQSIMVFETIATLEKHLRDGVGEKAGAATIQRYYSVAAVSRLVLVRMYQIHLEQYDLRWLPRMTEIEAQNESLMTSTREAISAATTDAQRAQLANNLKVQEQSRQAISVYRGLLETRRLMTVRGLAMAEGEAVVAVNTLKTLEGVFSLAAESFSNTSEYEALMNLSSPELLPLDGETLNENFIALNDKLGQS